MFDENCKKVFNVSLNILQNIEDAEDVTQEVFIEVFHSLEGFSGKSRLSTWIYRIAVNKSLDFLKAKKRKKRFTVFTQLFRPETGSEQYEIPNFNHPGILLENKERTEILFKAIAQLPEKQKTAFILTRVEDFPQAETALIMGLHEKAVESLLQRAKENLKKSLGNLYYGRRI